MIWIGLLWTECELLVRRNARKRFDLARWDVVTIGNLVQVRGDVDPGTFDGGTVGDVEVAEQQLSTKQIASHEVLRTCDS